VKSSSLDTYSFFINTIRLKTSNPLAKGTVLSSQKPKENESFTCQNECCRKAFAKPLKALILQSGSGEVYEACPRCLSRTMPQDERNDRLPSEDNSHSPATQPLCSHYLGYLCERTEKDQIPDECVVCKNIIPCMLKNLRK
jgi:hypothetical protein